VTRGARVAHRPARRRAARSARGRGRRVASVSEPNPLETVVAESEPSAAPSVAPAPPTAAAAPAPVSPEEALRSAAAASVKLPDSAIAASKPADYMFFTVPEQPVAGAPCKVLFNKPRSEPLGGSTEPVRMLWAFNGWAVGTGEQTMARAALPDDAESGSEWYVQEVFVSSEAYQLDFVFSDGKESYENNQGQDFSAAVQGGPSEEEWHAERAHRAQVQADRAAAQAQVAQERDSAAAAAAGAAASVASEGGWVAACSEPAAMKAGAEAKVRWNGAGTPLSGTSTATLHFGFNGWFHKGTVAMERDAASPAGEEWWEAPLELPDTAQVLNFVVSSADEEAWDNNSQQDYALAVEPLAGAALEAAWEGAVDDAFAAIVSAREEAEVAEAAKQAARLARREEQRRSARDVLLKQMRHVVYTEPSTLTAGEEVTLYYNPSNTNLDWSEEVWVRGSYNRWTHESPLLPTKLEPIEGSTHMKATVRMPEDAWMFDFVFSSSGGDDGVFDNRGTLDYHLPVEGSATEAPPMNITHIAVEMAPIAKVGGLGDVVTSLGRAMKDSGHQVEVILPKYQFFDSSPLLGAMEYETHFDWGGTCIWVSKCQVEGLWVFFIEPQNGMFQTGSVYGRDDDGARFDFFCKAALEFLLQTQRQPDILHCHDWSTAPVAPIYWADYHHYGLWNPRVVFTIHNLDFGAAKVGAAVHHSQIATTVSPSYAGEISGHPAVAGELHKFHGVRNGIDPDIWDPETDAFLPVPYNADSMVEGKAAAKQRLRETVGLTGWGDKPVVGIISRLTAQKGIHLIKHAAHHVLGRGAQFVLLGSAPDPKIQADFDGLAGACGGQDAAFCFSYNEPLSHLIYAGCDMILVPSMFEPCGLTQMTAMRYGCVPVVRATGGLRDTVFDVDTERARAAWEIYGSTDAEGDGVDGTNGFSFEGTDEGALNYALDRALDAWYNDRGWFHGLGQRAMRQDWSWNRPAIDYLELYHAARK